MKANSSLRLTQTSSTVDPSTIVTVERSVAIVYGINDDPNAVVKVVSYQVTNASSIPSTIPTRKPSLSGFNRFLTIDHQQYYVSFIVSVTILQDSVSAVDTTPSELAQRQQDMLIKSYLNGNLSMVMNIVSIDIGASDVNSITVYIIPIVVPSPMPTVLPTFHQNLSSNRLSGGAIAVIVIGSCAFVAIIMAIIYVFHMYFSISDGRATKYFMSLPANEDANKDTSKDGDIEIK